MADQDDAELIQSIVFGHNLRRLNEMIASGDKVAHYTTADNGLNILKGKTVWLRNAAVMNDHSEIAHGQACLNHVIKNSAHWVRLAALLDRVHPGLLDRVMERLDAQRFLLEKQTYLVSLAQTPADDRLGKLSMWRAYGGDVAGVALILNTDSFLTDADYQFYHSPVLYGGPEVFAEEFGVLVSRLEQQHEALGNVRSDLLEQQFFNALSFAILSTKHPGFAEEEEWRILYQLVSHPSPFIAESVESIRGIPQIVCKLPLSNPVGMDAPELEIPQLLHRVIIGPCLYPDTVGTAYAKVLYDLGIKDPWKRIAVSDIPLRQWG